MKTPEQEYRDARALVEDATRRGDWNAVMVAKVMHDAALERLRQEGGAA